MISNELIKLIEEYSAMPLPNDDTLANVDLYDYLGIYGDTADELLKEYRKRFEVSLAGFDFESHFPCEGEETIPAIMRTLPWMKIREYEPLTIDDLQQGIKQKYLGADPATVAAMHAPLTPEEEEQVEMSMFRLKNRLIYKPFFIITILAMGGSAVFYYLAAKIGLMLDSWFLSLLIIHPILMSIFVIPKISLLRKSYWMEDPHYFKLQGGAMAILSFVLPVMVPTFMLYKYLEGGRSSLLVWAMIVFITGLFAFFALIHIYPFNPQKLKKFARDRGIDIKALRLK